MTMKRLVPWLRWHASVCWGQLTPAALLFVALVVLWAGLQWQVIRPLGEQVEAGRRQLYKAVAVKNESAARLNEGTALVSLPDRFLAFLPPLSESRNQLQAMTHLLQRDGITIGPMEFRQSAVANLPAERLFLRLALQGDYSVLRSTLQSLLNRHPNLAILTLSLERSETAPEVLGMTLEAEVYYRLNDSEIMP